MQKLPDFIFSDSLGKQVPWQFCLGYAGDWVIAKFLLWAGGKEWMGL